MGQGFNAQAVTAQLAMWWQPLVLLGEISGFAILVFAVVRMMRLGARNDQGGMGAIAMAALAGVLLMSLSASISAVSTTFFGSGSVSPLAYAVPSSASGMSSLEIMGLTAMRLIGLVGFIRGLWYLKQSGDDPSVLGHAFTRIIGGMLAMHFHAIIVTLESSGF